MQRRQYLVALPFMLAGCAGLEDDIIEQTPADETTPTPDGTPGTPTPDDTPEQTPEETPDPENGVTVSRIGFIHSWEYLKGFGAVFPPDVSIDFRRQLSLLYELSLNNSTDDFEVDVTYTVETETGQELAAGTHSYSSTDYESEIKSEPIILDRANDPGTVTATIHVNDLVSATEIEERTTLDLNRVAGSSTAALVERDLDSARYAIAEAVEIFKERGEGELTNITAESSDISMSGIIGSMVETVPGKLRDARRHRIDRYEEVIDQIDAEHELIKELVRSQRRAPDVLENARTLYRELGREGNISSAYRTYRDAVSKQSDRVLDRDSSVVGYYSVAQEGRTVYSYDAKIGQVREETETFQQWLDIADNCRAGIDELDRARTAFDRQNYQNAVSLAENAEDLFVQAIAELGDSERLNETVAYLVAQIEELEFEAESVRRRASREM